MMIRVKPISATAIEIQSVSVQEFDKWVSEIKQGRAEHMSEVKNQAKIRAKVRRDEIRRGNRA